MQQGKPNLKTSEEDVQSVLKLVEYDSKLHRNYNYFFCFESYSLFLTNHDPVLAEIGQFRR